MIETENKKLLMGVFLDVMKRLYDIERQLLGDQREIRVIAKLQDNIWGSIKSVVGMPEKEQAGVFESNFWLDNAISFFEGSLPKDEVIERIMNWKTEPKE